MSTITKERANLKAFITGFLSDPAHDNQTLHSLTAEVFRIALASLEAEAVPEWTNEQCLEFLSIAFRHAEIKGDLQFDDIRLGVKMVNGSRAAMLKGAEPVTTACKLPTESAREKALAIQLLSVIKDLGLPENCPFVDILNEIYRLQSGSPVIPVGWVACSERMPEQFVEFLVCTEDGARYIAALNQRMTWDDGDFFDDIQDVTHWQLLPSPPAK